MTEQPLDAERVDTLIATDEPVESLVTPDLAGIPEADAEPDDAGVEHLVSPEDVEA